MLIYVHESGENLSRVINKPKIVRRRGGQAGILHNTDFSCCDFYEKIKSNKDFLKKVLSTEKHGSENVQIYKCLNIVFCLVKCIILVFLGVLTIGI